MTGNIPMRVIAETATVVDARGNPYLLGMHEPLTREIDIPELDVIGDLPSDLRGIYLRNGPNPRQNPLGVHHWFDGDGMLHGARIGNGKIGYCNRWVRTKGLQAETDAGHAIWPGLIDPPNRALGTAWGADRWLKDTANTDVVFHNGKAVASFYQCGDPYLLDPVTLETLGTIDLAAGGGRSMSAHNMVDETSGELMFFDYATVEPYMTYGVLDAAGRLAHLTPIELPGPRLPHTLAITEHYTILMDLPLFWDPELLKRDAHKVCFFPELPSRFGVIPRHGSGEEVRWFEADPTYIYHIVNAWEEGDEIVLDGCSMGHPEPTSDDRRRFPGPYASLVAWMRLDATYHRWRFNLATGECREEALSDLISEFPMVNGRYYGRRSRYSYHATFADAETVLFDGLVKHDSVTGTTQTYAYGEGRYGSEAPFAPADGGSAEDDGYVITFVTDVRENRAELLIFDARDIAVGPICRALIPQRIPSGFHSCWAPGEHLVG